MNPPTKVSIQGCEGARNERGNAPVFEQGRLWRRGGVRSEKAEGGICGLMRTGEVGSIGLMGRRW